MSSRTLKSSRKTQSAKRALTSPSDLSILSSLTSASKSSSGSNSTVTQESVSQGKHRMTKVGASRRPVTESRRVSRKDPQHTTAASQRPNVFAYMENGDEDEERDVVGELPSDSDSDAEEGEASSEEYMPAAPPPPISAEIPFTIPITSTKTRPLSLHSDSGISIRSTSPERASPISPRESALKSPTKRNPLNARRVMRRKSTSSGASSASRHEIPPHQLDEAPESFYPHAIRQTIPSIPSSRQGTSSEQRVQTVSVASGKPKKPQPSPTNRYGYDLLASNLSAIEGPGPKPLYLRFEDLNNRVILSMQDEIVSMKRDLEMMDKDIAEIENLKTEQYSRRRDFEKLQHPLYAQRLNLFGILAPKLREYNQIVASYNSLLNIPSASPQHVQRYKSFLEEHNDPIVASEVAFLNRISELAVISREDAISDKPNKATLEAGAAILMTVMAFKLVPNLLGRIALAGVVVLIMTWAGFLPADLGATRGGWGQKTAAYVAAIFVLAVAV